MTEKISFLCISHDNHINPPGFFLSGQCITFAFSQSRIDPFAFNVYLPNPNQMRIQIICHVDL